MHSPLTENVCLACLVLACFAPSSMLRHGVAGPAAVRFGNALVPGNTTYRAGLVTYRAGLVFRAGRFPHVRSPRRVFTSQQQPP
eukprot:g77783.t1